MERERKFWIKKNIDFTYSKKVIIYQSYINKIDDFYEIRLRKYVHTKNFEEDEKYYLDFKSPGGLEREEFGIKLTKEQYDTLIQNAKYSLIKTRFYMNNPGMFFDVYDGNLKGLLILEVEGDREYVNNFKMFPDWECTEVTYDLVFKNRNLVYKKYNDII